MFEVGFQDINVQPGESYLVKEPSILRTVLGSCVSATFFLPRLGVGAICHPMLPICPKNKYTQISPSAGRRYVDYAICDLAQQFDAMGARRDEIEVKLFGGADVLQMSNTDTRPTVGKLNCEAAIRVLSEERFNVLVSSLAGTSGISIQFNTATGEVLLKRLNTIENICRPKRRSCGRKICSEACIEASKLEGGTCEYT